jgi:hypothetical protein
VTKILQWSEIQSYLTTYFHLNLKTVSTSISGKIDVNGMVRSISMFPGGNIDIKFGRVTSMFNVSHSGLTTLDGCPDYVGGEFVCTANYINDLIGGPSEVRGSYICVSNNLTSLNGLPKIIGDDFRMNLYPNIPTPILKLVTLDCSFIWFVPTSVASARALTQKVDKIIVGCRNKLKNDKTVTAKHAIWQCQKELIDNGFEQYASW